MAVIALVAQSLILAAYIYHLATEHTKDVAALRTHVQRLSKDIIARKKALEGKNEYIKRLEADILDGASTDDLSSILTRLFTEDPDSVLVTDLPAISAPYTTGTIFLPSWQEQPETD